MTNEERQQAIEWLKHRPVMMSGAKRMYDLAVEALEAYAPDTNVGDMISRQAAIEVLRNRWLKTRNYEGIGEDIAEECEIYLKTLPSAQPERRCVNCGRTVNNGGWYEDGRTRCPIEEHYALPKDGYCHLWEKRKDWEDDYVKRAEEGEQDE